MQNKKTEDNLFIEIILFPIVYIFFAIFTSSAGMRVFYFIYVAIFIATYMNFFLRIKKDMCILIIAIFFKWIYDLLFFRDTLSDSLLLGIFIIVSYIFSEKELRVRYILYLIKNEKTVFKYYILYFIALIISILLGNGISTEWGTISLQGPYGLAHILAYELLIIAANAFICYQVVGHVRWLIMVGICLGLIALTTVRTVLLAAFVVIIYYFLVRKDYKKILYMFAGGVAFLILLRYTNLFSFVLEKTVNAINNGSITNYRSKIWESSLNFFLDGNLVEKVLGGGLSNLMKWNLTHVNMEIQAHNDVLTVLSAFGIVALVPYLFFVIKLSKGKGRFGFLFSLFVLITFNGLYSYCSFVLGIISFRCLFECINPKKYKMKRTA